MQASYHDDEVLIDHSSEKICLGLGEVLVLERFCIAIAVFWLKDTRSLLIVVVGPGRACGLSIYRSIGSRACGPGAHCLVLFAAG